MEVAPSIVTKLWEKVSYDEALRIVEENDAWDSCADGIMAIHPTISFEEALVLVVYYEDPSFNKMKEQEMMSITQPDMLKFIRSEIKKLCVMHSTLSFDEMYMLAKYKYLSLKK